MTAPPPFPSCRPPPHPGGAVLGIAQAPAHYGGTWWATCPHCEWLGTFHSQTEAKEAYYTHQEEKHDRLPEHRSPR